MYMYPHKSYVGLMKYNSLHGIEEKEMSPFMLLCTATYSRLNYSPSIYNIICDFLKRRLLSPIEFNLYY